MAWEPQYDIRRWEVTIDGKLWPCCFYANAWDQMENTLLADEELFAADERDPYWNDLNVYTMKEIEQHDMYQRYMFTPGWNSDAPPPICVQECAVVVDEYTGEERSAAKIQVSRD